MDIVHKQVSVVHHVLSSQSFQAYLLYGRDAQVNSNACLLGYKDNVQSCLSLLMGKRVIGRVCTGNWKIRVLKG
jgi:hypothetical protein